MPFLHVTCQPVTFLLPYSINNRKYSQLLIYFLLHFDICSSCLKFSENFMTICETANEMYEFENGNTHCNTNV